AEQEVSKGREVAGAALTAPLRRARKTDLQALQGLEGAAQAEQPRVLDRAVVVELRHDAAQRPRPDPAQPFRAECRARVAIEGETRRGPGVGRENQAAVAPGPPPSLLPPGGQHPVADREAQVAAIRPQLIAVE